MKEFTYTAKDSSSSKIVKGKVSADDRQAAAALLNSKDLYPIKIEVASAGLSLAGLGKVGKVKTKDRVIFTRQLATLVKAGLPITQALDTAIEQVTDKKFKSILDKIAKSVEGGQTLAESFGQYPDVFDKVYINLVDAGEQSGTLEDVLIRLADQQEKDAKVTGGIRGALIYPGLVLVTILGVMIFMLTTVMPQIQSLYKDMNKTLPITTRATIFVTQGLINFWYLDILFVLAAVFGFRAFIRTPYGRQLVDTIKLNIPIFGVLFRKVYMSRFTHTLGSLVASGMPLLNALKISAGAMNNVVLEKIVLKAEEQVRTGKPLSDSLENNDYFIKLVPQMIRVGEESGTLGSMLDRVSTFYEEEVDQAVKNISTIIEPVTMVFLGGMVMFIIVAILYPVYSLIGGGLGAISG